VYVAYVAPALGVAVILTLCLRFWGILRRRRHDPIEYYASFDGCRLPLRLTGKITSEEAQTLSAAGRSYYIGYFRPDGRLVKAAKMLRGVTDIEHVYAYSPRGRFMSAAIRRSDGAVTLLGAGDPEKARRSRSPAAMPA
jgi:hypothetical protein